jgi:hypothetical protein
MVRIGLILAFELNLVMGLPELVCVSHMAHFHC